MPLRISDYKRVIILGSPGSGKTTLSRSYVGPLYHTDDELHRFDRGDHRAQAQHYYRWLLRPPTEHWCIEGVPMVWALDLWTIAEEEPPCDLVVTMFDARRELNPGLRRWRIDLMSEWKIVKDRLSGVEIECR